MPAPEDEWDARRTIARVLLCANGGRPHVREQATQSSRDWIRLPP